MASYRYNSLKGDCSLAQKAYDGPVSPKQLLARYYVEYFVKTSRGLYTGSTYNLGLYQEEGRTWTFKGSGSNTGLCDASSAVV